MDLLSTAHSIGTRVLAVLKRMLDDTCAVTAHLSTYKSTNTTPLMATEEHSGDLGSRPALLRSLFPSLNGPHAAWFPSLHTRTGIFHGMEKTFSSFIKSACVGAALHMSLDQPAACGNCGTPSTVPQRSGCSSQGTKYEEAHKCWC